MLSGSLHLPPLPKRLAELDDDSLLEAVQQQTFRYFWEAAHPVSGLARDRQKLAGNPENDLIAIGGSGFGVMAILVAAERGWIGHAAALSRLRTMIAFLGQTPRYRGMFPHFIHGRTGATIPFRRKDDGADIVETTLLFQGLICAREYFHGSGSEELSLRRDVNALLSQAEWNWFVRDDGQLSWHWSPRKGWSLNIPVVGWNECLLTFVLAAGSPHYAIDPEIYHRGFAGSPRFRNGKDYYGIELPLGGDFGGPLFFSHYSFCGLDPRGLVDRHADYWQQNIAHTRINHLHCVLNPHGHAGYGPDCWGLTASHGPAGYAAHAPDRDSGVITPSAALSSFPYLPGESMQALRGFLTKPRSWGRFGFVDAFCEARNWYARTYLAINQGPIVAMIENHRSGLLWELFMSAPEVRVGLSRLGFKPRNSCHEPTFAGDEIAGGITGGP